MNSFYLSIPGQGWWHLSINILHETTSMTDLSTFCLFLKIRNCGELLLSRCTSKCKYKYVGRVTGKGTLQKWNICFKINTESS